MRNRVSLKQNKPFYYKDKSALEINCETCQSRFNVSLFPICKFAQKDVN